MSDPVGPDYAVVVPTIGRPSLAVLLASLARQERPPREVVVADDRPGPGMPLDVSACPGARVVRSGGRGPAAARNAGRRTTTAPWVVTLDDDVVLPDGWSAALAADLARAGAEHERIGAVAGRIVVPLPRDRRPTDWERSTAGLERARWATADMAFPRTALEAVGGFDERFPRAYREDADLAARLRALGYVLVQGDRHIVHPVRPADRWVSVRVQRGNADDALMRAVHGPDWRRRTECGPGRLPWHLATVGAALAAGVATAAGRPRAAALAGLAWAGLTGEFAWRRIAPGPRTIEEILTMLTTSVAIPPAAVAWRAIGIWRHGGARPGGAAGPRPRAVLFDRDGTLVHDVPYNRDPTLVRPVDGARRAVDRLRAAGLRIGLVTNQSGVARGLLTADDVRAVNAELQRRIGPFDAVAFCPHGPDDGCACRKPAPGLVLQAARALGVRPEETVVIGDIGADVGAAHAAGARAILVPTTVTRAEEIAAAPVVAPDLDTAVGLVLAGRREARS
ncbi:MAG TPA: HAD-IIIA family hydrolase [Kineosporiaceae bacterium]|nr:HAD-IIIA family hydrolase [Kineosporiaceae bacterium]